jgi:hypothetical protein
VGESGVGGASLFAFGVVGGQFCRAQGYLLLILRFHGQFLSSGFMLWGEEGG